MDELNDCCSLTYKQVLATAVYPVLPVYRSFCSEFMASESAFASECCFQLP